MGALIIMYIYLVTRVDVKMVRKKTMHKYSAHSEQNLVCSSFKIFKQSAKFYSKQMAYKFIIIY